MNRSESQAGLGPEYYTSDISSGYWGHDVSASPENSIDDLGGYGFSIVEEKDERSPIVRLGPRAPRISNGARAQAELEDRYGGTWDKYGEHNFATDPEDYGYVWAEGRSRPQERSGLYSLITTLAEKAEEDADFRDLRKEKEAEERQRRAETALTVQALKAAWDAMTPEQQETARREGNQRIAKRTLAASRDKSRDYGDRRLFLEGAARRVQRGAHLELTEEERRSVEEIKRKWRQEEKRKVEG
ncbi:MAG: hypothetical protein Q4A34_02450 [Candidatus Saccharibacteria bacterium]|nr:hypothetical protein [Candidatus Saccharibacteria bacterium]